jgi:hypothetical protein
MPYNQTSFGGHDMQHNRNVYFESRARSRDQRDGEPQHIGAILAELLGRDQDHFFRARAPENRLLVVQTPLAALRGMDFMAEQECVYSTALSNPSQQPTAEC